MPNSSIRKANKKKLGHPGGRTGEGAESIVPYLREEQATKPQPLPDEEEAKPRKTLTGRVRSALRKLTK